MNWNASAHQNALRTGLLEEMKDTFQDTDMPEELPTVVDFHQKWDIHTPQQQAAKATPWTAGGIDFTSSPKPSAPPKDPTTSPAGTVAVCSGPVPTDLS